MTECLFVIPSVRNFQEDQLNSRRLPVFPGGIKNSRRFPVIPEFQRVVDSLMTIRVALQHSY